MTLATTVHVLSAVLAVLLLLLLLLTAVPSVIIMMFTPVATVPQQGQCIDCAALAKSSLRKRTQRHI